MAILGAMQAAFAVGFANNAKSMGGMLAAGGAAKPDFNSLYVKAINETKGGLNIKDLQNLQKMINTFEPELFNKFKKDAAKLGTPAKNAVSKAFRGVSKSGPLGAPKRPGRKFDKMDTQGRLSWGASRSRRNVIDVTYKGRTSAALNKSITSGFGANDKTLSLIRVRVKGPAYVLADIGGKGRASKSTGTLTRSYNINLFGRGIVTRKHKINADNVNNWLQQLRGKGAPSRYAWPAFTAHAKDYQRNFGGILNELVMETNRKLKS